MYLNIWEMSRIDFNMQQAGIEHFMKYFEILNG